MKEMEKEKDKHSETRLLSEKRRLACVKLRNQGVSLVRANNGLEARKILNERQLKHLLKETKSQLTVTKYTLAESQSSLTTLQRQLIVELHKSEDIQQMMLPGTEQKSSLLNQVQELTQSLTMCRGQYKHLRTTTSNSKRSKDRTKDSKDVSSSNVQWMHSTTHPTSHQKGTTTSSSSSSVKVRMVPWQMQMGLGRSCLVCAPSTSELNSLVEEFWTFFYAHHEETEDQHRHLIAHHLHTQKKTNQTNQTNNTMEHLEDLEDLERIPKKYNVMECEVIEGTNYHDNEKRKRYTHFHRLFHSFIRYSSQQDPTDSSLDPTDSSLIRPPTNWLRKVKSWILRASIDPNDYDDMKSLLHKESRNKMNKKEGSFLVQMLYETAKRSLLRKVGSNTNASLLYNCFHGIEKPDMYLKRRQMMMRLKSSCLERDVLCCGLIEKKILEDVLISLFPLLKKSQILFLLSLAPSFYSHNNSQKKTPKNLQKNSQKKKGVLISSGEDSEDSEEGTSSMSDHSDSDSNNDESELLSLECNDHPTVKIQSQTGISNTDDQKEIDDQKEKTEWIPYGSFFTTDASASSSFVQTLHQYHQTICCTFMQDLLREVDVFSTRPVQGPQKGQSVISLRNLSNIFHLIDPNRSQDNVFACIERIHRMSCRVCEKKSNPDVVNCESYVVKKDPNHVLLSEDVKHCVRWGTGMESVGLIEPFGWMN